MNKILPRANKFLFGGDYNPEQWPEEIWNEDMRLFALANVDTVTLNVFSWASLQPSEEVYDFSKLDRIMEMTRENHLNVILATSTAAHPAWMARRYPDTLKVRSDGTRAHYGGRQQMCPNSPVFRRYAVRLADRLAQRYGALDNLVAWHVSNEYGGYCYCETCTGKFRTWLKRKYGTIDNLNAVWNTAFWGHTFYDFDEIPAADQRSEEFHFGGSDGPIRTNFQGLSLDYRRFMSESFLECYCMERDAIKRHTPRIPVTTNFMGNFSEFDYKRWAKEMDFISWDNYPRFQAPDADVSFWHDLMRGLKGGLPFSLMEQTPGVTNWHPYATLKRPGVMRLWSYQAIAHGSDTVLFFQMRRTRANCEKYHSALIDHAGHENTRVFREMTALGRELVQLGDTISGAVTRARAAIFFDWEIWWATSLSAGPSIDIDYLEEIHTWYRYFYDHHVPVDIVGTGDDVSSYDLLLTPMLYLSSKETSGAIHGFVKEGGTLITSYFSGYADENDQVIPGGYPGWYRDLVGIWVEESDALPPDLSNSFRYKDAEYPARILCDLIHTDGAESLSSYQSDFYAGMSVVTRHSYGAGTAYYVGTRSNNAFYDAFLDDVCNACGITPLLNAPRTIEITRRENENGAFYFLLNHGEDETAVSIPFAGTNLLTGESFPEEEILRLPRFGAAILQQA